MEQSLFLLESEAAELLRLSPGTLQNKRLKGDGPAFLKLGGRIVYEREALLAWALSKRRNSTSDTHAA
jgi:hypothetical protein